MRLITIHEIPLDEPLSRDVYHSCAELLLPVGSIVKAAHIAALEKLGISSVVERDPHETVAEIRRKLLGRLVSIEELGGGDKELRINLYDSRGRFLYRAGTALTDEFISKLKSLHEGDIYVLQSPDQVAVETVRKFAVPLGSEDFEMARELETVRSTLTSLSTVDGGDMDLTLLNKEDYLPDPVSTGPSFSHLCWKPERRQATKATSDLRDESRLLTGRIHENIRHKQDVDVKNVRHAIDRILLSVVQDASSSAMHCRPHLGSSEPDYLSSHALNTTTLASMLASEMGYSTTQVAEVAASAFLSNVGALRVRDDLATKPKHTAEDRQEMRRSSALGIEVLRDFRWLPTAAPHVAYQFRERLDGSGYPRKRKFIHPYARIVGLVDAYDAMTADRPYRKAMLPYNAMETIIHETSRGKFDRQCMKAFLKSMSLFPVGSLVELSSSRVGWVVRSNPEAIDRPMVKVVREGNNNLSQPYMVDTLTGSRVERPLDPKAFALLPS